ncbi:MAG: apolipoprotein N-acyltransferase [Elainellaceae cyanobacterium]
MPKLRHSNLALGLAATGGIAMGATAAPVSAWPLAWVALAPLWIAVRSSGEVRGGEVRFGPRSPLKALSSAGRYGFAWGFLYGGIVMHWLWYLHPLTWMGVPWLASVAIAAFCWAAAAVTGGLWIGAWAALFSFFSQVADRQMGHQRGAIARRLVLGTGLWGGLDWAMQQGILYWPSLALTQSPVNLAALHLSRLSGPATLSMAIVAVNGLVAEAWLQARALNTDLQDVSQRASKPQQSATAAPQLSRPARPSALIAAALGLLIALHGAGLLLLWLPSDGGIPLTVGIVQGNVPTRIKLYSEGVRRALQGYSQGYSALVDQGADLVVLPEGALPFRWDTDGAVSDRNPLAQAIQGRGITALVGTFALRDGKLTQSLLAVEGDGTIAGRYDKIKLVPLGEYIPLQNTLGKLVGRLSPNQSDMLPGQRDQRFTTSFGTAIAGICYESAFPAFFRLQAAAGGTLLVTASNNDPYPPAMMAQHHAQDLMRAIETDRWAVRATNTGYSGIIDSHGRTRWRSEANVYSLKLATVEQRSTQTLYVRWGDWLTPLLVWASGLWLLIGWVQRRFGG